MVEPIASQDVVAKLLDRLVFEPTSGCWLWPFAVHRKVHGYGVSTRLRGRSALVHVTLFEAMRGPVPPGTELDHRCRTKRCANPSHLEPVTHGENVRRGFWGADRATCKRGHVFDGRNDKQRICNVCRRDARQRWRQKVRCAR